MELLYRRDMEAVRQRLEAFWNAEPIGRPFALLTAPASEKEIIVPPPAPRERLLDFAYRLKAGEAQIKATYYGGEAVPCVWPDFSPEYTSACIGGDLEILERSPEEEISGSICWAKNVLDDWDRDLPKIKYDENSVWLRRGLEFTELAVRAGKGKYMTEILDVDGGLDTAASLRGAQRLCMDMLDCPDNVGALLDRVREGNRRLVDTLFSIVGPAQGGMINTWQVFAPGKTYNMRSDFAYMIDPGLFREIGLEYMIKESEYIDHIIFHTHTEDILSNFRGRMDYLDVILDVPRIHAVEWSCAHLSIDACLAGMRRILEKGKLVYVSADPERAIALVKKLGRDESGRVIFSIRADSVAEAENFMSRLEKT